MHHLLRPQTEHDQHKMSSASRQLALLSTSVEDCAHTLEVVRRHTGPEQKAQGENTPSGIHSVAMGVIGGEGMERVWSVA